MAEALSPMLPPEIEAMANRLLTEASQRGLKLATAESCTGGLVASLLTDVPLLSHAFERGFVTYSNEAKQEMLDVSLDALAAQGPVCEAVARQMAAGALARSRADVALAVTGWTESGPDPDQPGGLVWFACIRRGRDVAVRCEQFGDIGRARVRLGCLEVGLKMMLEALGD